MPCITRYTAENHVIALGSIDSAAISSSVWLIISVSDEYVRLQFKDTIHN